MLTTLNLAFAPRLVRGRLQARLPGGGRSSMEGDPPFIESLGRIRIAQASDPRLLLGRRLQAVLLLHTVGLRGGRPAKEEEGCKDW